MTLIAIITSLFTLLFLVALLVIMLTDRLREVVKKCAMDYLEVWFKYHDQRLKIEQEERSCEP